MDKILWTPNSRPMRIKGKQKHTIQVFKAKYTGLLPIMSDYVGVHKGVKSVCPAIYNISQKQDPEVKDFSASSFFRVIPGNCSQEEGKEAAMVIING